MADEATIKSMIDQYLAVESNGQEAIAYLIDNKGAAKRWISEKLGALVLSSIDGNAVASRQAQCLNVLVNVLY